MNNLLHLCAVEGFKLGLLCADALDIDSIPTRASSTSSKKKPRAPAAVTYSYLATGRVRIPGRQTNTNIINVNFCN
jgi:hypothetical protein